MTSMPTQRRSGEVRAAPSDAARDATHRAVRGILVGLGFAVPLWSLLLWGLIRFL